MIAQVFLKKSFKDILGGRCVHMNVVYIQVRKKFIIILEVEDKNL